MQPDEVRIHLLAHPHEGLHEGRSQFRSEQPAGLQHGAEGQHLGSAPDASGRTRPAMSVRNDCPIAWTICDGRKSAPIQSCVSWPAMKQAAGDQGKAKRERQSRLHETKQRRHHRGQQELRQRDPHQNAADLDRTVVLHHGQKLRDEIRRREDGKAKERDQKEQQRNVAARGIAQIDPRPRRWSAPARRKR